MKKQNSTSYNTSDSFWKFCLSLILIATIHNSTVFASVNTVEQNINVPEGDVAALINAIIEANDQPNEPAIINLIGTYVLSPAADVRIPFNNGVGNTGLPSIESDITIAGNNAIIERDPVLGCTLNGSEQEHEFRILHVAEGGSLTLQNLQAVRHGCSDGAGESRNGGGVYVDGGQLTLINTNLVEHQAQRFGGGIYNAGGSVIIQASTLSGNTSGNSGAGVYTSGGSVQADQSTFSSNTSGTNGGGIYNTGGQIIADQSVLTSNSSRDGGGIYSTGGSGSLVSSQISDNSVTRDGGGLRLLDAWSITATQMIGNQAARNGGGINKSGTGGVDVINSIFDANQAGVDGGGMYSSASSSWTFSGSEVTSNSAGQHGGGVYNSGSGDMILFTNMITGNSAVQHGGGIYSNGSGNNQVGKSTLSSNSAGGLGGGAANLRNLVLTYSLLTQNQADQGGAGFSNASSNANLKVSNTTLWANTTAGQGGAVRNATDARARLSFVSIAANSADQAGGFWNDGQLQVTNSIVANSTTGGECRPGVFPAVFDPSGQNISTDASCTGFTYTETDPGFDSGGLDDHGGFTRTVALTEESPAIDAASQCTDVDGVLVTFDQREVARPQGVACDLGAYEYDDDVVVAEGDVSWLIDQILAANANPGEPAVIELNGIFTLSPAADQRIPFFILGNTGLPAITSDITLTGNSATIRRDPVLGCTLNGSEQEHEFRILHVAEGGSLTLQNLQAVRHGCSDGAGESRNGGGVYVDGGQLTLINTNLVEHQAQRFGGGIYNAGGSVIIQASTLSGNTSGNSGAGVYTSGGSVQADQSTFSSNTSGTNGGGIYNTGGAVVSNQSTFTKNRGRDGAGVYSSGGSMSIITSNLSDNKARRNGGGALKTSTGTMNFTETILIGNSANQNGGAIHNTGGGSVTLFKSRLSNNLSIVDGAGFFNSGSGENNINESTILENSSQRFGGGIANRFNLNVNASTISSNESESGGGGIDNSRNITIVNSTIAYNTSFDGGGILNGSNGETKISASTINGNSATRNGGGISNENDGTTIIKNSIVSGNPVGGNCQNDNSFTALGANLSNDGTCDGFTIPDSDPLLDPDGLKDHGGSTQTIALMPGSPALRASDDCTDIDSNLIETDQRGMIRPQGDSCDLGAFEAEILEPGAVAGIHPNRGGDVGSVTVTIFGSGFDADVTVKLTRDGFSDILGEVVDVTSDRTQMKVRIDLTDQIHGLWDLTVVDLLGIERSLPEAFTIGTGAEPDVWIEIQAADILVGDQSATVNINYGNRGDANIYDVLLYINLPKGLEFTVSNITIPDLELEEPIPPYFETEDKIVLPLWIYNIPARSTQTIRLNILPPDPPVRSTWDELFSNELNAEAIMPPMDAEFTRTGNFDYEPYLLFKFVEMVVEEALANQNSPNFAMSSQAGLMSNLLSDDVAREVQETKLRVARAASDAVPSSGSITLGYTVGLVTAAACASGIGFKLCIAGVVASGALALWDIKGALDAYEKHKPDVCPSEPSPEDNCGGGSRSFGHPHFMTFDRLDYDFQAVGEFVLTRSTIDDMQVQIRLEQFNPAYEDFTIITAVAMNVEGDEVVFVENRESFENVPNLLINRTSTDLPALGSDPMVLPGGGTITRSGRTFIVRWPENGARVDVRQSATVMGMIAEPIVSFKYNSNLEGLLGNMDGNRETDFTTRDGTVLITPLSFNELYRDFGDSWRISDEESLFGTPTFADLSVPTRQVLY